MNDTITVETLFQNAIALEKAAESLYRNFQNMFAAKSQVAIFWKRYADEENGHAQFIERILTKVDPQRLQQPTDPEIMHMLQSAINRTLQIDLTTIKTLQDAHQLAHEIETNETNAIFEFIFTHFSDEELTKSQAFLRNQLNRHANKLVNEFPHEYQTATARQAVPTQSIPQSRFATFIANLFPNASWRTSSN